MASCSLGASNMKLSKLDFGRATVGNLQKQSGLRAWKGRGRLQHAGVAISHKSREAFSCRGSALETELTTKEIKSLGLASQLIPNSSEIESLVTEICNTTSIAELELKLGGFRLYVRRDLTEKNKDTHQPLPAPPPPASLAVTMKTTTGASDLNGSVSTSLAISKQEPSSGGIISFLDRAADEGLMILQSPRVGFFRRSRTIKGKRAPPPCKEKQIVKEGQVLCFIEQLGGELPIETDISGEVIRILREDGEPVGYGDALIAILPSFPGIKKLQ
ncbi:PREDICTED: biotin carboxyl carrier protein of acetyl-CoA carboxylase 1, chloroplastic-like [Populus euphratica]|uniref:Biotin carboxyl carrier protein of acetyl-CoA carboxylase 1, chloroplastic-like n=1 Tax=Populus euphratica TaxID=75702 RepID=A0AAJ6XYM8_POPEU|nr:PREDICTED: biotin carboxyl carrier protein of acetyl-CoA carboxylase 1, chloroplastic-like [Populus euphratica]